MSAALGLYRLQQIDSQMDQARARLEVIRQALENDVELRQASEQATSAEAAQCEAERVLRQAEAEAQSQRIKIEQAEASLYGGSVRNPKELQDLQKDVVSLKKHLGTLEDQLLEAMLANDESASSLTRARSAFSDVTARRGDQAHNLTNEQASLLHNLERFEAERKAALAPLDPALLDRYETLRRDKRGLAVTTINDGACNACGTTLTPGQQQSARSSAQITNCPSCSRILFSD